MDIRLINFLNSVNRSDLIEKLVDQGARDCDLTAFSDILNSDHNVVQLTPIAALTMQSKLKRFMSDEANISLLATVDFKTINQDAVEKEHQQNEQEEEHQESSSSANLSGDSFRKNQVPKSELTSILKRVRGKNTVPNVFLQASGLWRKRLMRMPNAVRCASVSSNLGPGRRVEKGCGALFSGIFEQVP